MSFIPRVSSKIMRLIMFCILLTIAACAPKAHLLSDQTINDARQAGSLEQTYDSLQQQTILREDVVPEEQAQLTRIRQMIAIDKRKAIEAAMQSKRNDLGYLPKAQLQQWHAQAADIAKYDTTISQELVAIISKEQEALQQYLADKEESLLSGKGTAKERLDLYQSLLAMQDEAEVSTARDNYWQELIPGRLLQVTKRAMKKRQWEEALANFALLKSAELESDKLDKMQKRAALFLNGDRFLAALKQNDMDKALHWLIRFSDTPDAKTLLENLQERIIGMRDYFASQAEVANNQADIVHALDMFSNAETVQRYIIGAVEQPLDQKLLFLDQLFMSAKQAERRKLYGQALAYLLYIDQLSPEYPGLITMMRNLNEQISARAVRQLSVMPFEDSAQALPVAAGVTSSVIRNLFEHAGGVINFVERGALKEILREQEIKSLQHGSKLKLIEADYILQGRITDVSIDTDEQDSKKTERVLTGSKNIPNPEFLTWQALTQEQREQQKKQQQPVATLTEDVTEDIKYTVTYYRKTAMITASYNVVDANDGKMLFSDNISVDKTFEDFSHDSISLGDYSLEMKRAKLPSDSELSRKITGELAKKIANALIERIGHPIEDAQNKAMHWAEEEKFASACESLADAYVLAKKKTRGDNSIAEAEEITADIADDLRRYVYLAQKTD
ncbi:MAG: hypothetical protein R8K21_05235 [Mariprofundales bacterium]